MMAMHPSQRFSGPPTIRTEPKFANSFGEDNAYMFSFHGYIFLKQNSFLITTRDIRWRFEGEYMWQPCLSGAMTSISEHPKEILIDEKHAFKIDDSGWEEIPFLSVATMVAKIVEAVDYVEVVHGDYVYALLKDSWESLGCKQLLHIMTVHDMIELVHLGQDKSIYMLVKDKVDPREFLQYEKEVRQAYERIVK
jgi:hypothetical protein